MKNNGRIQGSLESAVPVWIPCPYWVYEHTNIRKTPAPDGIGEEFWGIWEYDEVQYTAQEYMQKLSQQTIDAQMALLELAEVFTNG